MACEGGEKGKSIKPSPQTAFTPIPVFCSVLTRCCVCSQARRRSLPDVQEPVPDVLYVPK